jgi:hypothetical protein
MYSDGNEACVTSLSPSIKYSFNLLRGLGDEILGEMMARIVSKLCDLA